MKERIFLVDDEQPVLDGLSVIISKYLPELSLCGTARSGKEAIDAILQERPDILIMDVRMPGMSGLDVLKELDRLDFECISILLTAYERFDIAKEAFALGVFDYLVKPVEQETFIQILHEAMLQVRKRKERSRQAVEAIEQVRAMRPILEEGFLHYLLLGDNSTNTLINYYKMLGWDGKATLLEGHCAVIHGNRLLNQDAKNQIRTEISNFIDCISGTLLGVYILLYVPGTDHERTNQAIQKIQNTHKDLQLQYAIGETEENQNIPRSLIDAFVKLQKIQSGDEKQNISAWQLIEKSIEKSTQSAPDETALFIILNQLLSQQLSSSSQFDRRV